MGTTWTWTPGRFPCGTQSAPTVTPRPFGPAGRCGIPQIAVEALQEQLRRQAGGRARAEELWQGVPVGEIARLAGHASSRTTEVVYRRELLPVITTGAEIMDQIFQPRHRREASAEAAG